jgi:hypothetical protein
MNVSLFWKMLAAIGLVLTLVYIFESLRLKFLIIIEAEYTK